MSGRRAHVVWAHPVAESFNAALHRTVLSGLDKAGWEVDDCDLYAEGFQPVLTADERRTYHDEPDNIAPVRGYVERLQAADALVLVFPVWNFGYPAILKGYFDRVFLPGVSFTLQDGRLGPNLYNIRHLTVVTTYGATRFRAWVMGDPPRRVIRRALRAVIHPAATCRYHALYDMNNTTAAARDRFLERVADRMARL